MSFLNNLDPRNNITIRYVPFDERLDSHPKIAGYVEITGNAEVDGVGDTKASLSSYVNGLKTLRILPGENVFWKRDGNEFRMLEMFVRRNEEAGIKEEYIILTPDKLKLMWKGEPGLPKIPGLP